MNKRTVSFRALAILAWIVLLASPLTLAGCTPAGTDGESSEAAVAATSTDEPAPLPPSSTPSPPPPTPTPLPPTATPIPPPSATPLPEPTATPSPLPVPPLERTLSLQSPALQGDDVQMLQEWLQTLGYTEVGVSDGIFGGMTDEAVRRFQEEYDLTVDGIVGEQTWALLFSLSAGQDAQASVPTNVPETGQSWYVGAWAGEVREIEKRLMELGYEVCHANRDFSEQTAAAVQQFQAAHGLEADGVVGPQTWDALFDEAAVPASPGVQLSLSNVGEVGSAIEIAFDGKNLWLVRKETLDKIDPASGSGLNSVTLPDVGEVTYEGRTYPVHFVPQYLYVEDGKLWVAGRAAPPTASGDPVVQVFTASGKPESDPIYFGLDDLIYIKSVFPFGGKVWALLGESMGPPAIVELNAASGQAGRRVPLLDVWGVNDAVPGGNQIWVAINIDEDPHIRGMDLNTGVLGPVLGVCGEELAFDGRWVWANKRSALTAVDPATGEIMAHAPVNGYARAMASDGKGTLWVLVAKDGDTFLYVLETR